MRREWCVSVTLYHGFVTSRVRLSPTYSHCVRWYINITLWSNCQLADNVHRKRTEEWKRFESSLRKWRAIISQLFHGNWNAGPTLVCTVTKLHWQLTHTNKKTLVMGLTTYQWHVYLDSKFFKCSLPAYH